MGTFPIRVHAGDETKREFREVDALVDTGASYTRLPAPMLRELGVDARSQRRFLLANGGSVMRDVGQTWVRIDGHAVMTIVVFADAGAMPLLGAVSLEEMGLGGDLVARKLIEVPGLLM